MKKIIIGIVIVSVVITTAIYIYFKNDKVSILALGDSVAKGISPYGGETYSYTDYVAEYLKNNDKLKTYYRNFTGNDLRTSDLINIIKNNEKGIYNGRNVTIQQAMVKSEVITISIGSYDLYNHLGITNGGEPIKTKKELNDYFMSMFTDLNNLLELIKSYTSAEIVIIGFHNPEIAPLDEVVETFEFIDNSYKKIAEKNNCTYISINKDVSGNEEYFPNSENIHFNYKAHKLISDKIIKSLKL